VLAAPLVLAATAAEARTAVPARVPAVAVAVARSPISPNGDGVRERTWVAVTVDSASTLTVSVQDRRGTVVAPLASARPVEPGRVDFVWNGRGTGGRLADGAYTVRARAVAAAGAGQAEATVVLDTARPRVTWRGRWGQRVFGGLLPLSLAVADRGSSTVGLQTVLHDQTGRLLSGFSYPPHPTGSLRVGWHPRGGLESGAYRVQVAVTDEAGNTRTTRPRPFLVERQARPRAVAHVDGVGRRVALTFDDCGSPSSWASILGTLRAFRVKAAFFCPGIYVLAAPAVARRTLRDGHTIGSHGWDHANFEHLSYGDAHRRLVSDREAWWHLAKASPTPLFLTCVSSKRRWRRERVCRGMPPRMERGFACRIQSRTRWRPTLRQTSRRRRPRVSQRRKCSAAAHPIRAHSPPLGLLSAE